MITRTMAISTSVNPDCCDFIVLPFCAFGADWAGFCRFDVTTASKRRAITRRYCFSGLLCKRYPKKSELSHTATCP
jgi:hypothetical protein